MTLYFVSCSAHNSINLFLFVSLLHFSSSFLSFPNFSFPRLQGLGTFFFRTSVLEPWFHSSSPVCLFHNPILFLRIWVFRSIFPFSYGYISLNSILLSAASLCTQKRNALHSWRPPQLFWMQTVSLKLIHH